MDLCENSLIYGDEDSSDESDDEEAIRVIRKKYTVRPRPDLFNQYDNEQFFRCFRFRKNTVNMILNLIEDRIRSRTDRNKAVSPLHKILLTLQFYATGNFQVVIGDSIGIHKSTVCRIIKNVTEAIASLRPRYIRFPNSDRGARRLKKKFYKISRFPGVAGAIDCTHIKIQSPGGEEADVFKNGKGIFTMNVQAICDGELKFLDIVARWPGSTRDSKIFDESRIRARFINGEMGDFLLLGDGAYACSNFLLTPLLETPSRAHELYNESQLRTRRVIERCFRLWKQRFPALALGLRMQPLGAQAAIVATAVLHNIAQDAGEPEPPADIVAEAAIDGLEIEEKSHDGIDNAVVRQSLIDTYFECLAR